MPRFGLPAQALAAVLFWVLLGTVVYYADPGDEPAVNAPARAGFSLALLGALFFTLLPILRVVASRFSSSRMFQQRAGMVAVRQSLMLASFVVINALLQMVRAWTGLTALLIFSMLAVIEVVALARR